MFSRMIWHHTACWTTIIWIFWLSPLTAATLVRDVDVAIVLAVDISLSIDAKAAALQRDGHVRALRSRQLQIAIRSGREGCIAIIYFEWSGSGVARNILPWTVICNENQALDAARKIEAGAFSETTIVSNRRTSISYAIDAGSMLLKAFPGQADRKIIDISSNGTNNDGVAVLDSRRRALRHGHVINAIVLSSSESGVTDDLPGYFRQNVIGGPGAFVIMAREPEDYSIALLRKMMLEITGLDRAPRRLGDAGGDLD